MIPPRLVAALESRHGVLILRWSVRILFALSLLAWFVMGADRPDDPYFEGDAGRSRVPGFAEVGFTVEPPPELAGAVTTRRHCGIHAESNAQRVQGMQRRSDFAGYAGMVFSFESDSRSGFINHNVPIGLSIAWFDGDGRFVSSADMPPCATGVGCPQYYARAPYRTALEVPIGGLPALGIASGSRIAVGGRCPAAA